MSIICIAKGTATIGMTTWGADGKIISQTPARWEHDPRNRKPRRVSMATGRRRNTWATFWRN